MMPNMNPKQMKQMMKQLGMNMEEIPATEVIIKTSDREIIITEPKVSKIKAMGQETFQIVGIVSERELDEGVSEDDVKLVMEQANVSEEEARRTLEETGDIAEAILKLKK